MIGKNKNITHESKKTVSYLKVENLKGIQVFDNFSDSIDEINFKQEGNYHEQKDKHLKIIQSSKKEQQIESEQINELINVPIYKLSQTTMEFKLNFQQKMQPCFALGTLIGKFYELDGTIRLQRALFMGSFKGAIDRKESNEQQTLYFQGKITNLVICNFKTSSISDQIMNQFLFSQTSFKGLFKGNFYKWHDMKHLESANLNLKQVRQISNTFNIDKFDLNHSNDLVLAESVVEQSTPQYYLPTVVRFEITDAKEINLQKSLAVITGQLFITIFYSQEIGRMIKKSKQFRKELQKTQITNLKYENLLKIGVNFQRDFSLIFTLYQQESEEDDTNSQDSQWTIQDKTWDVQFQQNQEQRTFKFTVWKRFNAQIDNSYGSFFAPFNLSVVRIVITLHSFTLIDDLNRLVKVCLMGTDVLDFDEQKEYNPFQPLADLDQNKSEQSMYPQHRNRLFKINNLKCKDNGSFIIADNRLTLYPHYKNVLLNKCTANDDYLWSLGIKNKLDFLAMPEVCSISQIFTSLNNLNKEDPLLKYHKFSMMYWNNFIVQIPMFKYVIVDIIQIFIPIVLFSVISLIIFNQNNGISTDTGYTTISYRIVNVCSLLIAYVSLIPALHKSLPPMPTITLIQILTYIATIPNLLAMIHSMLSYTISQQQWLKYFRPFQDKLFIFCFVLQLVDILTFYSVLMVYWFKQYNVKNINLPQSKKNIYKYRSPCATLFMQNLNINRSQYKIQKCFYR